jgi:hypothetical protein
MVQCACPGEYNKLIKGTVWAYREEREEQLTLVGARV